MSLQSTITNVSYINFGFVHAKRGEFVADFYQLVGQRKSFENRLTFGDVVGRSLVSCFFDSRCRNIMPTEFRRTQREDQKQNRGRK